MLDGLAAIALLMYSAAGAGEQRCRVGLGEMVPTAAVARDIAVAVMRGRRTSEESADYELVVEKYGKRGKKWNVRQDKKDRVMPNGDVIITAGGGGISMLIDRCDGKISKVYLQR